MKKFLYLLAAALGAAAVLFIDASPASAQTTIVKQDAPVTNTGVAVANTGGNSATGSNEPAQEVIAEQIAVGTPDELGFNADEEGNEAEGEAVVTTGNATANGNIASTKVTQTARTSPPQVDDAAAAPASGPGPDNSIETSDAAGPPAPAATGAALGGATSGTSTNAGSAPTPAATTGGSPGTDVSASGAPTAWPEPSDNSVEGAVSGAGPPGLTVVDQAATVDNTGVAVANTGINDGDDITTGDANATGNRSDTEVAQAADVAGGGLVVVDQTADVDNFGLAIGNTGLNEGGTIVTGNADATGNVAVNTSSQTALVGEADLAVIDQSTDVGNLGAGIANTGLNTADDGDVETGNARAAGNVAANTTSQDVEVAAADPSVIDQATDIDNLGGALANTGRNDVVGG